MYNDPGFAKPPLPPGATVPPAEGGPPEIPPPEAPRGRGGVPPEGPPPAGGAGRPEGEPFAANIRLSKYPEDIRGPIKEWADSHSEAVQEARRGVRSDAQVLEDARSLVDEVGGNFAKLQREWRAGEAWNAEEVTAIRGLLREKTADVLQKARVAVRARGSVVDQAELIQAIQEQARVQEIVHGVTAEAGRALRAFRQEAAQLAARDETGQLQELLRRASKNAKPEDVAAAVMKAGEDLNNPSAIHAVIRDLQKPSLWDMFYEVWINGKLSGPTTHIINELSNLGMALTSPVERGLAAGVERVIAPLQRRPVARFFEEVPADAFGALRGIDGGVRAALRTLRDGITPSTMSKWEFRREAIPGKLGRIIRAPGTALEAADAFNYSINYNAALEASMMRLARSEGLKGNALVERLAELRANPTEALTRQAQATAEYRLFRAPPGSVTSALMHMRDVAPGMRFVLPFLRTPSNLLKAGKIGRASCRERVYVLV